MKLRNPLLAELNKWAYADNIIDVFVQSKGIKASSAPISGPLEGDLIAMGSQGVNVEVIELKEEYIEEYGLLTTEEAKLIFKGIFSKKLVMQLVEIESYNDAQLAFALDIAANALFIDFDKYIGFNPKRAIRAALDLWDKPDADDLRDEIEDGFGDLHWSAKGVTHRYNHVAMGHGGIVPYFMSLK